MVFSSPCLIRNKLGISKRSSGIELRARDGTDIRAVSSGDVVFSGYLRGYGNTIVIYHGYKYYTVTSRIEKILVEKGRKVKRGQTIGIMGDTATLFDEGLYFEIRQGKTSLDPLLWLNPNKLNAPQDLVNNGKNNRADSVQAKN
jgi:murein DD-endopeptidase MepM/ murein hydrolase activator NlpD